jgi:hypothetical protein
MEISKFDEFWCSAALSMTSCSTNFMAHPVHELCDCESRSQDNVGMASVLSQSGKLILIFKTNKFICIKGHIHRNKIVDRRTGEGKNGT